MLYTVGESLDLLIMSQGQYEYASLVVAQPFDVNNKLEASDSNQKYYIRVPQDQKTIELITNTKSTLNIINTSPVLEAANDQMQLFMIDSKSNAKVPALRGGIKGLFSRNCTTTPMTGSAATVAAGTLGITAASGHIGGDAYSLYYINTSGGIQGKLWSGGVESTIRGYIANGQLLGEWQSSGAAGSFGMQSAESYDILNIELRSTDCKVSANWEGYLTENGQQVKINIKNLKVSGVQVSGDGSSDTRGSFVLTGFKLGNRMRLLIKYKNNQLVVMHLLVANRNISGIWTMNNQQDGVQMKAI